MLQIILASGSARRKELLEAVGLDFTTHRTNVDEKVDTTLTPDKVVKTLALRKAAEVADHNPQAVVIGSDTIIYLDGEVIGKPHSQKEAKSILQRLSGNKHSVYTGVCVISGGKKNAFCESAKVTFSVLSNKEIDGYVATGECFDKAGAYAIQGIGASLISRVDGNIQTVIGLPVGRLMRLLQKLFPGENLGNIF